MEIKIIYIIHAVQQYQVVLIIQSVVYLTAEPVTPNTILSVVGQLTTSTQLVLNFQMLKIRMLLVGENVIKL